jgi:RNA polymerase II elongation factor ELL
LLVVAGEEWRTLANHSQQLRYADKTHALQTSSESSRYELYHTSGAGSDETLDFTSLINHSLIVQKAQVVTAGVDTALEQLKNSMAAISELKQANKYASPVSLAARSGIETACCRRPALRRSTTVAS